MLSVEKNFTQSKAKYIPRIKKDIIKTISIQTNLPSKITKKSEDSVAILLCIYNGKNFLQEQLESIKRQTHKNWKIYISDDGECDYSKYIIQIFSKKLEKGRVTVINGPRKGFVENFLTLTCNPDIDAEYFAYSDQDDIWNSDKLEKSIKYLQEIEEGTPSLYCSRTLIVNEDNMEMGLSPLFTKPPSFINALVQNIGGGNTMLFNRAARSIAMQVGSNIPVITHDWWMYLLISGVNGKIIYDSNPTLRYRQHKNNLVGCNITWKARFYRCYLLLRGRFKEYNKRNELALYKAYNLLSKENKKNLDEFSKIRNLRILKRIKIFKELKIYRQTKLGNMGIWVAVIFNKL